MKNCGTAEDFTTQSASGTSSFESLDCSGLFAGDNDVSWDRLLLTHRYFTGSHFLQQLEGLKVGMRLEAVDKKNPHLICVATVDKKTGDNQILIHFDGWSRHFDYTTTINDLALHPVGFCERKSLKLEAPKGIKLKGILTLFSNYLIAVVLQIGAYRIQNVSAGQLI